MREACGARRLEEIASAGGAERMNVACLKVVTRLIGARGLRCEET